MTVYKNKSYHFIYTKQELDALHPDAVVAVLTENQDNVRVFLAKQILPQHDLPAVLICPTGALMDAARKLKTKQD